jgi:hypothetical protein
MRLAVERESIYALDFPFIDYGIDLHLMAEMEKGIKMVKIKRSEIDTNPPPEVLKKVEERLAMMKPKRHDFVPIDF